MDAKNVVTLLVFVALGQAAKLSQGLDPCTGSKVDACDDFNGKPAAECEGNYVVLAPGVAYQCSQAVGLNCGTTGPACEDTGTDFLGSLDFSKVNDKKPSGSWMLALNIDTSDGHSVQFENTDFWESETETGTDIAQGSYNTDDWKGDYKDIAAYKTPASKVLILIHEGKTVKGWRSWPVEGKKSLHHFFNAGNACSMSSNPCRGYPWGTDRFSRNKILIGKSSDDSAMASDLHRQEPMVKNGDRANRVKELCANHNNGDDLNRLTTCGENVNNNQGWGLGTFYDYQIGQRPRCDGQLADTSTWNRGLIGYDQNCGDKGVAITSYDDCQYPWSKKSYPGASGLEYDYAIFIQQ